jgi:ketosteroid isomerase-like protein
MKAILISIAAVLSAIPALADSNPEISRQLLTMERQAMDGWMKGNPDPALAISDPEITYFHVMTDQRLDGLPAVKALYEGYRGRPLFESYEILDPKVQVSGDMAVLTYLFAWRTGAVSSRWNSTQVYQRKKEGWRVIHSHWSMTKPAPPAPQP